MNATSFTTDSAASATMRPGWRSVGRTRRSPKSTVKTTRNGDERRADAVPHPRIREVSRRRPRRGRASPTAS